MTLREQLRIAVIAGVVAEAILIAPLYAVQYSHPSGPAPLPFWILVWNVPLAQLQEPGELLVERLLHTDAARDFRAPIPIARGVIIAAEISVPLIQAALLSLGAFGGLFLLRSHVARRILARRSRVLWLAFGPPALLLLLATALTFPYLIDPDWAELVTLVACVWLVLASMLLVLPLALAQSHLAEPT